MEPVAFQLLLAFLIFVRQLVSLVVVHLLLLLLHLLLHELVMGRW